MDSVLGWVVWSLICLAAGSLFGAMAANDGRKPWDEF